MCLILLAWQVHSGFPLVVAANRDEYFARPTAVADYWPDHPQVLAGRDLEAGGTWLGITHNGRFAALTNFRNPAAYRPDAPSRGRLVADFLTGEMDIDAYLDQLAAGDYNGFNLLLGDGQRMLAFSNVTDQRHALAPGIYGLSNALLDTPWPKVGAGRTALATALTRLPDEDALHALLRDDTIHPDEALPATGVSPEWERLLSAAFVRSPDYGTRSSTIIKVGADGMASFDEQTWLPDASAGDRSTQIIDFCSSSIQSKCRIAMCGKPASKNSSPSAMR
jgi:uncharacterized protein with NRDE domain